MFVPSTLLDFDCKNVRDKSSRNTLVERFKMDEGIFSFYYVIAEAIRNFLVYAPIKFMLFALLVVGALIYFFAF